MIVRRFKCFRVIGINRYWIYCDGFTGEIILGDVGSGQGAAVAGVVGIEYFIYTKKCKFENIKLIFHLAGDSIIHHAKWWDAIPIPIRQ